jgi:hypothetical protein
MRGNDPAPDVLQENVRLPSWLMLLGGLVRRAEQVAEADRGRAGLPDVSRLEARAVLRVTMVVSLPAAPARQAAELRNTSQTQAA